MSHRQEIISIKSASIDNAIAPIVLWLNSIEDVVTFYSCEGSDDPAEKPYIMFFCRRQEVLLHIMTFLESGTTFELHHDVGTTTLLYVVRFDTHEIMVEYADLIESIDEEEPVTFELLSKEGEA